MKRVFLDLDGPRLVAYLQGIGALPVDAALLHVEPTDTLDGARLWFRTAAPGVEDGARYVAGQGVVAVPDDVTSDVDPALDEEGAADGDATDASDDGEPDDTVPDGVLATALDALPPAKAPTDEQRV